MEWKVTDFAERMTRLAAAIGDNRVETRENILEHYRLDGLTPKAVLFPRNVHEAAETVRTAYREGLSLVPWGSGTKIGTGNAPSRMDLVISTAKMDHMLDVDTSNLTVTVEAGVRFRDIQARLATEDNRCYLPLDDLEKSADEQVCSDRSHRGCFLPMDPPFSDKATIGGIVAANSTGPRRLLYRMPRDLLLGVRLVVSNGDIVGMGGKTVKNVSGYDLSKLMVGSFGSLGLLCEMTFKLLPLPEGMETLVLFFRSLADACGLADGVLDTPLIPAAVEVLNRKAWEGVSPGFPPDGSVGPYAVAIAMEAFAPAVQRMKQEVLDMGRGLGATGTLCFKEEEHRRFWLKVSDSQNMANRRLERPITVQLSYPISLTHEMAGHAETTLSFAGIRHTLLVHAGTGAAVITLSATSETPGRRGGVISLIQDLLTRCRESGGNLMVWSAPSDLKPHLPIWGEPGMDLSVMRRIKGELDPHGIFSPGRFVGGL